MAARRPRGGWPKAEVGRCRAASCTPWRITAGRRSLAAEGGIPCELCASLLLQEADMVRAGQSRSERQPSHCAACTQQVHTKRDTTPCSVRSGRPDLPGRHFPSCASARGFCGGRLHRRSAPPTLSGRRLHTPREYEFARHVHHAECSAASFAHRTRFGSHASGVDTATASAAPAHATNTERAGEDPRRWWRKPRPTPSARTVVDGGGASARPSCSSQ